MAILSSFPTNSVCEVPFLHIHISIRHCCCVLCF
jgi:hypothetical protein